MTTNYVVAVAVVAGSLTIPADTALAQSTAGAAVAQGQTRPMGKPFSGRLSTTKTRDATPDSGVGMLYAVLDGKGKLAINGTFNSLASPAKSANFHRGVDGNQGPKFAALTITNAASGVIKGDVMLSADDIADLQKGVFYVEVTTEAPEGAVRGWLIAGMLK
jgi:hypothetical protein